MAERVAQLIGEMEFGGAEQVVLDIVAGLDRRFYEPIVVVLRDPGTVGERVRRLGVPLISLDKRPGFDWRLPGKLIRVLRRERVALLHAHLFTAQFWGRLAAGVLDIPLVTHHHNLYKWHDPVRPLIDRYLPYHRGMHIGVSQAVTLDARRRFGFPEKKCRTVYNGIDIPETLPPIGRAQIGTLKILWAGRMVPEKNLALLIEACRLLKTKTARPFQVDLLGDGPEREQLEKQTAAAGLTEVIHFRGRQPSIQEWLAAAHLFVLSSRIEGLPMVLLEAGLQGVPALVTDVGGNAEIVQEGKTGLVVSPDRADLFAAALETLLLTPERLTEMAEKTQQHIVEQFSRVRMIEGIGACYRELI